jgi:hypothetical protein
MWGRAMALTLTRPQSDELFLLWEVFEMYMDWIHLAQDWEQ